MPKEIDIQFLSHIKEIFSQVFADYGFELQDKEVWSGNGEYAVTASKSDMELNFYLGLSPLFYYCALEIKLLGALAEKATSDRYTQTHGIGVTEIAVCLDPDYKPFRKGIQTTVELRDALEREKADLLKYCKGILTGNITAWSVTADYSVEQRKKSGIKIAGVD